MKAQCTSQPSFFQGSSPYAFPPTQALARRTQVVPLYLSPYLFTATINVGVPLPSIPVPGGVLVDKAFYTLAVSSSHFVPPPLCLHPQACQANPVLLVEPLTNGTITGPAINPTISGGIAYPTVVYNGTLQVPLLNIHPSLGLGRVRARRTISLRGL